MTQFEMNSCQITAPVNFAFEIYKPHLHIIKYASSAQGEITVVTDKNIALSSSCAKFDKAMTYFEINRCYITAPASFTYGIYGPNQHIIKYAHL